MHDKPAFIRGMFAAIASKYDLLNSLLSFGLDGGWRQFTALQCRLPPGGLALDAATGTGGLALRLARQDSGGSVIGVDFSPEMLARARARLAADSDGERVRLVLGDVLRLPFPDNTFDCVTMGFALRNVEDLAVAFGEMARVARTGGRVVALELTRPASPLPRALHYLYLRYAVPLWGTFISGSRRAYDYLPSSILGFPSHSEVKKAMERAGLQKVEIHGLALGTATVYLGIKGATQ